jgi:hypothetical protein
MSQDARDLRNAGCYLVVLLAFAAAAVFAGPPLIERAIASTDLDEIVAPFTEAESEQAPTRLSIAVDNAREIRAALAKPQPPLEPLPPITAKLAYGHLKPDAKPGSRTAHSHKRPKLPKAAMDAMASANGGADQPRSYSAPAQVELHRVY